ncbi:MAG: Sua5/YciO/YrdC/YwlC family protein, partial [Proteobacteria bacterium]|nr:Sua5/YciO/YrdC/YwlC family protein [Pseudomonadota bacterium]
MSLLDIEAAAALLKCGGVIAYPTEGVWGLGCDPRNEQAVMRILAIKQREVGKGLILIAANEAQLASFVAMDALDEEPRAAVRASWPGAATWIVPASAAAPRWI